MNKPKTVTLRPMGNKKDISKEPETKERRAGDTRWYPVKTDPGEDHKEKEQKG